MHWIHTWLNPPGQRTPPRTAAIRLWIAAGLTLLVFGYVGSRSLLAGLTRTTAELMSQMPAADVPPEAQAVMRPAMVILGTLALLLLALPAAVNLVLGFWIKDGAAGPGRLAIGMLALQTVVAAPVILLQTFGRLVVGDIIGLLIMLILLVGYLAMMGWVVRGLWTMTPAEGDHAGPGKPDPYPTHRELDDNDDEPWNAHLG